MANLHQFDDIRPYCDNEVKTVLKKIVWEKGFMNFIKTFFPEQSIKKLITNLQKINTVLEFQKYLIYPMVERIIKSSVSDLSFSGLENIRKNEPYIFMSNHRDIVLDSALLEYILVNNDFQTTEIAIGSNLLILSWIVDLVRLNRSFIVKRDVPRKELYKYSVHLSKYIRFAISQQKNSIWIAQREGRTKDGNDQTQIAVLKMLNLSGEKDFFANFRQLNIIPVTISYQLEPCAISKVQEIYNKKINPDYKKTKLEDLSSMSKGMETPKGKVHYSFGKPINDFLHKIEHIKNRKQRFAALKNIIDEQIYKNYKLSFYNYVAADIYFNTNKYKKYYNQDQKKQFFKYFNNTISEIKGDNKIINDMILRIYANPVKNYFSAKKHS